MNGEKSKHGETDGQFQLVYATAANLEDAQTIAKALVTEQFVACANIIEGMRSIYRWKGEIQEDQEVVIILKTQARRVDDVILRVKELHTYECPCVIAFDISNGNPDYLTWIFNETN